MHCGVDQRGSDLHAFRHLPPLENFETFSAEREREEKRREEEEEEENCRGAEKDEFFTIFFTKFWA